MNQSPDSFQRKILGYGTRNAKKLSIKSSSICRIHLVGASRASRSLILYLTTTEKEIGCVLEQHDEFGRKERAIFYLSKKFKNYESRYTMVEKLCYALV